MQKSLKNIQFATCEYSRNCADIVQVNDLFTLTKNSECSFKWQFILKLCPFPSYFLYDLYLGKTFSAGAIC